MFESILPYLIAIGIFIAGEFLIPVDPHAPNRKTIKHFWSTTLAMLALILSIQFNFIASTNDQLMATEESINDQVSQLEDSVKGLSHPIQLMVRDPRDEQLYNMFNDQSSFHEEEFYSNILNGWVDVAIERLANDVGDGRIPIAEGDVTNAIQQVYAHAKEASVRADVPYLPSIIATNVGGTEAYFAGAWYKNSHLRVTDDGVPVVRFFLHDTSIAIKLKDMSEPALVDIDTFAEEVRLLQQDYQMLFAAVIDMNECSLLRDEKRDFLYVNNALLLETDQSSNYDLDRIVATGRAAPNLLDAANYSHSLLTCIHKESPQQFHMDDSKVAAHFGEHLEEYGIDTDGENLAAKLTGYLLSEPEWGF